MTWLPITAFWRWWYTKVHPVSSRFTRQEALLTGRKHGLEEEVRQAMDSGLTPDEALEEWDLYPFLDR